MDAIWTRESKTHLVFVCDRKVCWHRAEGVCCGLFTQKEAQTLRVWPCGFEATLCLEEGKEIYFYLIKYCSSKPVTLFRCKCFWKKKKNSFTSVLKLLPIEMYFEMSRREKDKKGWFFKSVGGGGEIRVGNGSKTRVLLSPGVGTLRAEAGERAREWPHWDSSRRACKKVKKDVQKRSPRAHPSESGQLDPLELLLRSPER